MSDKPASLPETWLNRQGWLKAMEFCHDPFEETALNAETDTLFEKTEWKVFVDPLNFDDLRGSPDQPGPRYIFGATGTGKSSLRRRIKHSFSEAFSNPVADIPPILAIEYIEHNQPPEKCDAEHHVSQIYTLVDEALRNQFDIELRIEPGVTSRTSLEKLVEYCQEKTPVHGICVLVDNLDSQYFAEPQSSLFRIMHLAGDKNLLTIKGIFFTFMLNDELRDLAGTYLPLNQYIPRPIYLTWDRDSLMDLLQQRILTCKDPESIVSTDQPLEELFELSASNVEDRFVRAGLELRQPRAMWRLGYFLLEEFFQEDHLPGDRIPESMLHNAYERLLEEHYGPRSILRTREIAQHTINTMRKKIEQDEIQEAIELLKEFDRHTASHMLQQYNFELRQYQKELSTPAEYRKQLSRLVDRLLNLLSDFEKMTKNE